MVVPEEEEHSPLEAVTRILVQTKETENAQICALVNCNMCRTVRA